MTSKTSKKTKVKESKASVKDGQGANAPLLEQIDKVEVSASSANALDAGVIELPDVGEKLRKIHIADREVLDWDKNQIISIKAWVFGQEKENFDKVYLFRSYMNKDIKWWKAGGPSALYLSDYVYPMLKIDKPLRSDIDEFYTFNEGAISIRDIEVTKNQLYQVGVEPIVENDAIKVFQLRRNYTPMERKELQRANSAYREDARSTLKMVYSMPSLDDNLRKILRITYERYRNDGSGRSRAYLTKDYAIAAKDAYVLFRRICCQRVDLKMGLEKLAIYMDKLGEELYVGAELSIYDRKTVERLLVVVTQARLEVLRKIDDVNNGKKIW